ncbi:MAG: ATP-binding protein [Bacteroidota bacterium]
MRSLHDTLHSPARLRQLNATELLDSEPEEAFDRITRLASRLLGVPVTLVSLVTEDRQFFKSQQGLPSPRDLLRQTPLSHSFCQHVVHSGDALAIEDARAHPLVKDNRAVDDLNVIAYLGAPLKTRDNQALGSLCAIQSTPRQWTPEERQLLQDLADMVMTETELRLELKRQRKLRKELSARKEQYKSVVEGIRDAVFRTDADGVLTYVNGAWAAITGVPTDQAMGQRFNDVVVDGERAVLDELRTSTARAPRCTVTMQTPAGTEKWLEIRASRTASDEITGLITDVTDSHHVHAERLARQEAERLAKLKTAILGNMSHELRTPITAIIGYADLLRDEVGAEHQELVDMVRMGGERLHDTLDSVLAYAQIESGNRSVYVTSYDLADVVRKSTRLFAERTRRKGLTLDVRGVNVLSCEGDASAVHRILHNLLSNAIKFTETGGIGVSVHDRGTTAEIQVTDTGCGIPAAFLPKLFEPFEQASVGNSRLHEGSGLGMAITERLVGLLGGQIEVESAPDLGTTIIVTLPRFVGA